MSSIIEIDPYYKKAPQLVKLIHETINSKEVRKEFSLCVRQQSQYYANLQQSIAFANFHVLNKFYSSNLTLQPEEQMKYFDIYLNYFSETPEYQMEIPEQVELFKEFQFFKNQQQNDLTDRKILKYLMNLNSKYLYDLKNFRVIYLGGTKITIKVPLSQQVIRKIQNVVPDSKYQQQLNEIDQQNVQFDYIYQNQTNAKLWCYASDLFDQIVQEVKLGPAELISLLDCGRLHGKYPLINFDLSLTQLRKCDPTFSTQNSIVEVQTKVKYSRDQELSCHVDLLLFGGLVAQLTIYHLFNNLEYLLSDLTELFDFKRTQSCLKLVLSNEELARNIFFQYATQFCKFITTTTANCFFDAEFVSENQQELQQEEIVANLVDPLTQFQIKTPCRGSRCRHSQTLDLATYVLNCECPLCGQPVSEVFVDPLSVALIKWLQKEKICAKYVVLDVKTAQIKRVEKLETNEESDGWDLSVGDLVTDSHVNVQPNLDLNLDKPTDKPLTHSSKQVEKQKVEKNEKPKLLKSSTSNSMEKTTSFGASSIVGIYSQKPTSNLSHQKNLLQLDDGSESEANDVPALPENEFTMAFKNARSLQVMVASQKSELVDVKEKGKSEVM